MENKKSLSERIVDKINAIDNKTTVEVADAEERRKNAKTAAQYIESSDKNKLKIKLIFGILFALGTVAGFCFRLFSGEKEHIFLIPFVCISAYLLCSSIPDIRKTKKNINFCKNERIESDFGSSVPLFDFRMRCSENILYLSNGNILPLGKIRKIFFVKEDTIAFTKSLALRIYFDEKKPVDLSLDPTNTIEHYKNDIEKLSLIILKKTGKNVLGITLVVKHNSLLG